MKKILDINDKITATKLKGQTVAEMIKTNKKGIFELMQKGYSFTDNVFEAAHIKRVDRDHKFITIVGDRNNKKDNKIYPKDTKSVETILEELSTIDNGYGGVNTLD